MDDENNLIRLTADIVCSHLENNSVAVGDVPNLIQQVHKALAGLALRPSSSRRRRRRRWSPPEPP
jgi:predicted transcriptional regulator